MTGAGLEQTGIVMDIVSFSSGRWQARCRLCDWVSIWHLANAKAQEDADTHLEFGHPEIWPAGDPS